MFPPSFPAQALHYLETISPGPLLVQLLSALLGLSVFVLEEACSSVDGLSAAKVIAVRCNAVRDYLYVLRPVGIGCTAFLLKPVGSSWTAIFQAFLRNPFPTPKNDPAVV